MLVIAGSHRSKRRGTKRLRNIHIAVAILGSLLCLDRAAAAESGPDKRPTLRVPLTAACSYNECTPPWGDRTWQPRFKFAAAAGTGEWAAEFALPLNIFLKNKTLASQIGFNIRRSGMPGEETHCWQGTPENPGEWGVLTGIPARDSLPGPDYSTRGLNRKGELYVLSDTRPVRGVAELRVFDRRGRALRTITHPSIQRITGIAVDSKRSWVYVAHTAHQHLSEHTIKVFDLTAVEFIGHAAELRGDVGCVRLKQWNDIERSSRHCRPSTSPRL